MNNEKTLIGVLASHDSAEKNEALAGVFRDAYENKVLRNSLANFRFVVTGGTYGRIFGGEPAQGTTRKGKVPHHLEHNIVKFLHEQCGVIRLPSTKDGGVTMLSHLISQRKVSLVSPFLSPTTAHLLFPENLALLRLADQWRVKKLMNRGSVNEWLRIEAKRDARLNLQPSPIETTFSGSGLPVKYRTVGYEAMKKGNRKSKRWHSVHWPKVSPPDFVIGEGERDQLDKQLQEAVIALISLDEMKNRMLDFVLDYEHELARFKSIVATGTTGKLIQEASPLLANKVQKYHSGPKGGDIEIATEILCGGCHVVIFFVDPLHPQPHVEDIRVVFGACMINEQVRMLSNEIQARDWMDSVVRGR